MKLWNIIIMLFFSCYYTHWYILWFDSWRWDICLHLYFIHKKFPHTCELIKKKKIQNQIIEIIWQPWINYNSLQISSFCFFCQLILCIYVCIWWVDSCVKVRVELFSVSRKSTQPHGLNFLPVKLIYTFKGM